MKLYKVDFTINDDYKPKHETIRNISLTVLAADQFSALATAWERISSLGLDEPKSFGASRADKCD